MSISPKILLYDIEAQNLKASIGSMLCVGYKWLGQKRIYCPALTDYEGFDDDPTDDRELTLSFAEILEQADAVVTWYGREGNGFDQRFVNSKLAEHGCGPPPNVPMLDLWVTARKRFALHSNRLDAVAEYLDLPDLKTRFSPKIWRRAAAGHRPSMAKIVDHCRKDIMLLEMVYEKMRPWVKTHPRVSGYGPCANCGSPVQRRGQALTRTKGIQYKFQCTNKQCAAWETRAA